MTSILKRDNRSGHPALPVVLPQVSSRSIVALEQIGKGCTMSAKGSSRTTIPAVTGSPWTYAFRSALVLAGAFSGLGRGGLTGVGVGVTGAFHSTGAGWPHAGAKEHPQVGS